MATIASIAADSGKDICRSLLHGLVYLLLTAGFGAFLMGVV